MRKYFIEALVVSALIGFLIRVAVLLFTEQPLWATAWSYVGSITIAMVSCVLAFLIHMKVLTSLHYSFAMKGTLSSLSILGIYVLGNVYLGGVSVFVYASFYIWAIVVILVALPFLYRLNKRIRLYNELLLLKQSHHGEGSFSNKRG